MLVPALVCLSLLAAPQVAPADRPAADPAALAARALENQRAGRLAEAAEDYERLLTLAPRSWQVRSNLGVVYAGLGRFDDAAEQYRRALEVNPSQVAIRYNLALALYKAARPSEAQEELEKVLETQPDHPTATLLLADCHLLLGDWKTVIALLDPIIEKDPENEAVLYMLGTALMRDKQYVRGQAVVDRILRRGDSAEAHLMLALASREAQDDLAAREELDKALAINPELPTANGVLGEVLSNMGEGEAAQAAFRRELALNPNHFDSHLLLGQLLRQEYDADGALVHLRKALVLRPGDPGVRYQIALAEIARGEYEAAREILVHLVAEYPKFTEAHVSLATCYYRLRRRDDGDRHQAIVRELRAEEQAQRDAANREKQAARE
jgi:tetratricopeptide (TPR) repeat protein